VAEVACERDGATKVTIVPCDYITGQTRDVIVGTTGV
jgi:hypothetical protein